MGLRAARRVDCERKRSLDRHVLDADDALVGLELGNSIDQQKWIAVRENLLDGALIERQCQNVHVKRPV